MRRSPFFSPRCLGLGALVAAAAAVLLACGGGGGTSPGTGPAGPTVGALQASQPGELLSYVKAKLRERQDQRSAQATNAVVFPGVAGSAVLTANSTPQAAGVVAAATAVDRSSTTVQESGVDEDDTIKSDGTLIVTLAQALNPAASKPAATIGVHRRRADGTPELLGSLSLSSYADSATSYSGMYLASGSQRLAVLGASLQIYMVDFCIGIPTCTSAALLPYPQAVNPKVVVDLVSMASPAAPGTLERWRIDGRLVGSRLIGNSLVLVTQHAPTLAVDAMPYNAPAAERDAALARLTAADLLPQLSVNGGAGQALVAETDCYVEPKNANYGVEVTTITTVDLASPTLQRRSRCFIGGSEALYMSASALYLATTRYSTPVADASGRIVYPNSISTDIHKFAVGNGTVDYRGSGNVAGHLGWDFQSRSYRFSEHNGDLRVVSFTGQTGWGIVADAASGTAPSPATLSILRERSSDKSLQPVATLPNAQRPAALGKPGEQVYAVRFVGDRGYVVTFRRIDPLYVLDLSNPADPKTVGELTTAGFSTYLFPVGAAGSNLLLGIGRDADDRGAVTGVKVALFDVADPARPTQKFTTTIGDANTQSGLDYTRHGIDLLARGGATRVVLPVLGYNFSTNQRPFSLQRFEVDGTARTMVTRSALAASTLPASTYIDLGLQRTLQIGDLVYHWDGQTLATYNW